VTYVFYRVSYVFWKNGSQRFQLRNSIAFIWFNIFRRH